MIRTCANSPFLRKGIVGRKILGAHYGENNDVSTCTNAIILERRSSYLYQIFLTASKVTGRVPTETTRLLVIKYLFTYLIANYMTK